MKHGTPTTWWVHGSAPGGEAFFDAALRLTRAAAQAVSITCNAGLIEFLCHGNRRLRPDYYWLQDPEAIRLYGRFARTAVGLGTTILTHKPERLGDLHARRIWLVNPDQDPPIFRRGVYQHVTLSGLLCLQWVANRVQPQDTVLMTGMTGYASKPGGLVPDTFDGRMGKRGGREHTTGRIAPFTRSVCEALPNSQFIFCGKPHRVFGPAPRNIPDNVTVCPTPGDFTAWLNAHQTPFEDKGMNHEQAKKGTEEQDLGEDFRGGRS